MRTGMKEYSQWPTFPQVSHDSVTQANVPLIRGWALMTMSVLC